MTGPDKHPLLKYTLRRNQQQKAPGQEARFAEKEKIRWKDRQRVSFLCKYVIGMKKTGIPLN